MKSVLIINFLFFGIFLNTNAQWQETNFTSGPVACIATKGSKIFLGSIDKVYLSSDNGVTWNSVSSGITCDHVLELATKDSLIFAGTNVGMYVSTNNGGIWNKINNGLLDTFILALAVKDSFVFAGTYQGNIYRTSNNGSNWTEVDNGLITGGYISSLYVYDTSIFAGTDGYGIFISYDNGNNWNQKTIGLNVYEAFASFTNCGTNIFTASSDPSGILISTDNGNSWNLANTGMTATIYVSLVDTNNLIFAGTNTGVYLSSNNGNNWTSWNTGLIDSNTVGVIAMNHDTLYAGTSNNLWKRSLSSLTNINDISFNDYFSLFPNPAKNEINISSNQTINNIEIYNIEEQILKTINIDKGITRIDVSDLAKGMYFVKVKTEKGVVVKKFVKE